MTTPTNKGMPTGRRMEGLQRVFDSISEGPLRDTGEAVDVLREIGLDPDAIARRGRDLIARICGRLKLEAARDRRVTLQEHFRQLRNRLKDGLMSRGESARQDLAQFLATQRGGEMQVHFRRLEKLDPDAILDLLSDAELLRLWKNLDEEDEA